MKNINTLFNILLIIAVTVLYYLHFNQGGQAVNTPDNFTTTEIAEVPLTVYVNGDTLLNNYEYFKEIKKTFEAKTKKTENDLIARQNSLQKEFMTYQQTGASMSQEQRMKTEESLMQKEQSFREYSESVAIKLQEEELKLNEELYDKVSDFLKDFSKDKNYKIILNYTKGTGILFANDSLDITKEVLEGLNKEHAAKKKK